MGGYVTTELGMVSGRHHHGGQQTLIHVISGSVRMAFGTHPSEVVEAGPADFVFVAEPEVHRERDPGSEPAHVIVVRGGTGESVFDVEGPAD